MEEAGAGAEQTAQELEAEPRRRRRANRRRRRRDAGHRGDGGGDRSYRSTSDFELSRLPSRLPIAHHAVHVVPCHKIGELRSTADACSTTPLP